MWQKKKKTLMILNYVKVDLHDKLLVIRFILTNIKFSHNNCNSYKPFKWKWNNKCLSNFINDLNT